MIQPISLISPGPYYTYANMYPFRRDAPQQNLPVGISSQPVADIIDLSPEAQVMLANQDARNSTN